MLSALSGLLTLKRHQVHLLMGVISWCIMISSIALPALALDYNKELLVEVDFSGRDLRDGSFTKAVVRKSNFSHTNLQGVSLFGATLESTNLEGADLRNATLDTARFVRSNLTNAVLEGAFAFNAKFKNTIIDGADFTDVLLRDDMQESLCAIAQGTNPITGRNTRETLACE